MANKTDKNIQDESSFQISDIISEDVLSKYGWKALGSLLVVILGITFLLTQGQRSESKSAIDHKALGKAYVLLRENQLDSARIFLGTYINGDYGSSALSKANLLLGQILYQQGDYAGAVEAYSKVSSDMSFPLIASGGLHGLAASQMQLGKYTEAVELLEELVSKFGKQTGSPKKISEEMEEQDLSPTVPDALWKLTLCYKQLQQIDKAKQTSEKLVRIYGNTEEGRKASRFLLGA